MSGPLFGIVPAGQPLLTDPTSAPSETSFLYSISAARPFSHITVMLLPGMAPNFKFLGGIGTGKESATFKLNAGSNANNNNNNNNNNNGDPSVMIGVSVEPAESVFSRIQEISANKASSSNNASQPSTQLLAQNIIKNAFNFLASFSGTAGPGGVEVVPLKAFEEWWKKFESRVRSDPSFLERPQD
ncbi:uncharacterized protein N0V96_004752 [Colletotrichum fioriniae]|uniref:uncharacterized protein n=1 Tax=Colletotrichum fioriniae TaxID=710243 RepID=UPI0032DA0AC7|nr:hypothetical protein N0V96_004752 [Colletotrichum fioriniae]